MEFIDNMNYFDNQQVNEAYNQTYAFIKVQLNEHTLQLTLNRPEKKNAIHPHMVQEIAFVLQYVHQTKMIRNVVIDAAGDVFCAGADLKAFMGMVGEFNSSIPKSEQEILLGELFNEVHKPIITKVEGNVYAGGFFFLAGAHYVVCDEAVVLGLPEVKRGLFPFQVMAALLEVMPKRQVIDWCIRGYNLPVSEAKVFGLVTHLTQKDTINQTIQQLIDDINENSPTAIRLGLQALHQMNPAKKQHQYLMQMLQKAVGSKDGQEGLLAFKEKRKPVWLGE